MHQIIIMMFFSFFSLREQQGGSKHFDSMGNLKTNEKDIVHSHDDHKLDEIWFECYIFIIQILDLI